MKDVGGQDHMNEAEYFKHAWNKHTVEYSKLDLFLSLNCLLKEHLHAKNMFVCPHRRRLPDNLIHSED